MHETHLIKPIIKGISEHAQKESAHAVAKVRLKVGELLGVKEHSFREAFTMLSKGTVLEDAELELTFFPGTRIEVLSFDIN
ncbi:MAG: hydrogenase maturation nickel metallochaperone HypA [Candidatus Omnitrophica bacterium]|nr:hydrogenase maturation nickel metallochaperone HypA [Candidatus Omnitrophota bacterium]